MNKVQYQHQVVLIQVYKVKKKSFDKHAGKVKENIGSQGTNGMEFAFFHPLSCSYSETDALVSFVSSSNWC